MILQDFDVTSSSISEFVNFCECLERAGISDDQKNQKASHRSKDGEREKSCKHHKSSHKSECKVGYCVLHNKGHNTKDCMELKKLCEQGKGKSKSHKDYDKKKKSLHHKNDRDKSNYVKKKDVYAMIQQAVVKQSFATNPAAGTHTVAFETKPDPDIEIIEAFKDASISSTSNDFVSSATSKSSSNSSNLDSSSD